MKIKNNEKEKELIEIKKYYDGKIENNFKSRKEIRIIINKKEQELIEIKKQYHENLKKIIKELHFLYKASKFFI
jgi:hypothetical protein